MVAPQLSRSSPSPFYTIVHHLLVILREHETDNYSPCPTELQWINMTWRSDSSACHFPVCVHLKNETLRHNPTPIYANWHRKRSRLLLESCSFKNQLRHSRLLLKDLLPWDDTLERKKRGERKERWHVWIFSYNILHLFPFFLSRDHSCTILQVARTIGLCTEVQLMPVLIPDGSHIVHPSKERWKKTFLPQMSSKPLLFKDFLVLFGIF